ncbi:CRE-MLTN-13 protein [Aphelenchoides avenae]|nr:CRE-MLTN-13 protein [Aphelenchus avenae]
MLSPSVFNLHEADDGGELQSDAQRLFTSLPELIKTVLKNKTSRDRWLNFLMEISGLGTVAERLAGRLEPLAKDMHEKHVPTAEKVATGSETFVELLERHVKSMQKEDIKRNGFTFLDHDQLQLFGGRSMRRQKLTKPVPALRENREEPEDRLQAEIRRIARLSDDVLAALQNSTLNRRMKRQSEGTTFIALVLEPQFFTNNALRLTAFNAEIISPWFFLTNYFAPEFFNAIILSPTFFEANLGYPQFFIADILSPYIFQANALSPIFFEAFVLSPEILIADLLSPRILTTRVASPQILNAALLSPNIGVPSFLSDKQFVIDVLSPNILSPDMRSEASNYIDILSPDILSGGEENNE